jgi:hypothetical protein
MTHDSSRKRSYRPKSEVRPLQVYSGQTLVGELRDYGRGHVAAFKVDQRRRVGIGIFRTRVEAMRAISEGARSGGLDEARNRLLEPASYATGLPEHFLTAGRNQPLAAK